MEKVRESERARERERKRERGRERQRGGWGMNKRKKKCLRERQLRL